jgi:uncharacterized Zn ribbon protein/very-short-patch-repair endonuclease
MAYTYDYFLQCLDGSNAKILSEYKNSATKVLIQCACGNAFERTPEKCTRTYRSIGSICCVECSKKIRAEKKISDTKRKIKKELDSVGAKLLSDYRAGEKLRIIGSCGHEFERVYGLIKRSINTYGAVFCMSCAAKQRAQKKSKVKEKAKTFKDNNVDIVSYGDNMNAKMRIRCKCGEEFDRRAANIDIWLREGREVVCPKCSMSSSSSFEEEIAEILESNRIKIRTSDRKIISPKEIDIVSDDHKICIEFDGMHWHSETILRKKHRYPYKYHLNKTIDAYNAGYKMIHVFESEWINKKDIVQSVLLAKFGISKYKVFARKLYLSRVSSKDARIFYDENHLQGFCKAKLHYGLVGDTGEIIAMMSFAKNRYSDKADWELVRYAPKLNTSVIGGFARLLKHFRRNHDGSILSYADIRYSGYNPSETVYTRHGFTFVGYSKPGYIYFKGDGRKTFSRTEFQKHKLREKLKSFDPEKTEYQNMLNNGYDRIWDCGNMVFKMI